MLACIDYAGALSANLMSVSEGRVSSSLRQRGRASVIRLTRENLRADIGGSCDDDSKCGKVDYAATAALPTESSVTLQIASTNTGSEIVASSHL